MLFTVSLVFMTTVKDLHVISTLRFKLKANIDQMYVHMEGSRERSTLCFGRVSVTVKRPALEWVTVVKLMLLIMDFQKHIAIILQLK